MCRLKFTAGSGMVRATIPASVNVAPPGYYMLFIHQRRRRPVGSQDGSARPDDLAAAPAVASHADRNQPKVSGERQPSRGEGTLGSGSPTLVSILHNPNCTGKPAATGSPSTFTGGGITISVPDDSSDLDQCHGRQRRRRLRLLQLHLLRRVDQPAQHDIHVGSTPDYEQHHGELRLRRLGGGFNLHVPL